MLQKRPGIGHVFTVKTVFFPALQLVWENSLNNTLRQWYLLAFYRKLAKRLSFIVYITHYTTVSYDVQAFASQALMQKDLNFRQTLEYLRH